MDVTRVFTVPGVTATPYLDLQAPTSIGHETHPAAKLPDPRVETAKRVVGTDEQPVLEVPLPPDRRGARRLAVVLSRAEPGTDSFRMADITPGAAAARLPYSMGEPPEQTVVTQLVYDPPTLDITSGQLFVPAGAELTFYAAVHTTMPGSPTTALAFVITAVEADRETEVHRVVLDPGQRAEDRGWVGQRADLSAVAGRSVRLRFSARPVDDRPSASFPLWGNVVMVAPSAVHDGPVPVNVIVISLDTLRAISTGLGGARRPTTPCLDAIAAGGTSFDNAITTAPHTLPSHISLFSGLYLRHHGIREMGKTLGPEHPTLAERLVDAGYSTAAFTENGFVLPWTGIARGFQDYHEDKSPNIHLPIGFAARILRDGLDWIAAHRSRPFFLFLHTYQVHAPYAPPAGYETQFEPIDTLPDANARDLLRYEQEVRYLDDELCAFVAGLEAMGLGERTLLVITSDHGEEFGEHGQTTHGFQVYDEAARIVLVLRLPGTLPAGRRIPVAVSLVDVAPTVLDLLGLPGLPRPDGLSLLPLAFGRAETLQRPGVFIETISSVLEAEINLIGYRTAGESCIFLAADGGRPHGRTRCYDRTIDPAETGSGSIVKTDPRFVKAREAIKTFASVPVANPSAPAPALDREREEKLRALGYIR